MLKLGDPGVDLTARCHASLMPPAQVMNQGAAARVSGHDHFDAMAGQNPNGRLVDRGGDDRTHAAAEQPYPAFTWSDRGEQAPPLRGLRIGHARRR